MLLSLATSLFNAVRSTLTASAFVGSAGSLTAVCPNAGSFHTTSPPIKAPNTNTNRVLSIDTPPSELAAKILRLRDDFNRSDLGQIHADGVAPAQAIET